MLEGVTDIIVEDLEAYALGVVPTEAIRRYRYQTLGTEVNDLGRVTGLTGIPHDKWPLVENDLVARCIEYLHLLAAPFRLVA